MCESKKKADRWGLTLVLVALVGVGSFSVALLQQPDKASANTITIPATNGGLLTVTSGTPSPNSPDTGLCANGRNKPNFTAYITSASLDASQPQELGFNMTIKWRDCAKDTTAYAVYSNKFCDDSGHYAASQGNNYWMAHDCVKYIENVPDNQVNANLGCAVDGKAAPGKQNPQKNLPCTMSPRFDLVRRNGSPVSGVPDNNNQVINFPTKRGNISVNSGTRSNGSNSFSDDICQYYRYSNGSEHTDCKIISIPYSWTYTPPAIITPHVSLPGSILVGQTVTPVYSYTASGGGGGNATGVREFWISDTNDDAINGTDTRVTPANTSTVAVPASGYKFATGAFTTTADSAGKYLCASLNLTAVSPMPPVSRGGPNPATMCVPITKAPSLAVISGDVRTGGNYGVDICGVRDPGIGVASTGDQLSKYFGIRAFNYAAVTPSVSRHTYIRDAAISLGEIFNVATNASGPRGVSSSLHFARGAGNEKSASNEVDGGLFYGVRGSTNPSGFSRFPMPNLSTLKTHCLSPLFVAGRYPTGAEIPAAANINLPGSSRQVLTYRVASGQVINLNVAGGTLSLQQGQRYIVRLESAPGAMGSAVVNLNFNVQYTGSASSVAALPQFVLLAGSEVAPSFNISVRVAPNVTRLDGIYAVRGTNNDTATFSTCSTKWSKTDGVRLTTSDCKGVLTVNGTVIVGGRLNPYRTAGHDSAGATDPAEIFNLRPDVILSDYARNAASPVLHTIYQRELAPRY
jgi:hypothetical protein